MKAQTKVLAALTLALAVAVAVAGCGSSTPIAVALSLTGTQNVVAGKSLTITAMVMHDSKNAGVTWALSPSSGAGTLSAQTTTSVTYTAPSPIPSNVTATITATSVSNTMKTATVTIDLQAVSIALTPSAAQTLEQTQTVGITAAISNDPSTTPSVTWSLNTGAKGSLSGPTATGVTYHAPASVTAASTDTITATSAFDNTKTQTLTINLVPPPSVTPTSLPAGTVGTAYLGATLAATGGVSPYTWSWTAQAGSSLPPGLNISTAGAISGTPSAYGTFNVTVKVTDASNFTATANLSITIHPAPLTVTTTSLPNGIVNTPGYSATLASTGGATPITWSWAAQAGSTLPPGLVLAPTGGISGTPTSAGTFNVTVTATDSSTPALTATKNLSVLIIPQLAITTSSPLPNGITNTAYTGVTLASTGGFGAVVWSTTGGTNPPPGLSLNASTGAITGMPTTAGTFNFTVQAADSGTPQQKVTKSFTITIIQQLVITTSATLPAGSVTTPYSVQLASTGGTGAVTWALASSSTLPGGFTPLTATGFLSGTPTTAGTFNFSITATDSGTPPQTATVAFTLLITPKLAITTTSLPSGTVNTTYNTQVQSNSGGIAPLTWSWAAQAGSSTPPGLSISSAGVISGKPTAPGTFNVTVTVTDSGTPAQTASANFSISIATAPLSITTTSLPNAVVGQLYNQTLASAGGNPPVTWGISSGSLPSWASLNTSTGVITGTPPNTTGSPFSFIVKATDSSTPAQTATQALTITVVNALLITTTSLPNGTVGTAYPNTTVSATGGTTPYTWSWAAQAGSETPPGLSINSSSGLISGTPSSQGTFNVTVTVKDSATNPQQTASANFSITITVATLTVTTTSSNLPTGTVSTMYPNTQLNASGGISPYTWAWVPQTGSMLPPGLSLSTGGLITGTPTSAGTFNVTVTVTDSETTPMTANANLSITVSAMGVNCASGTESVLKGQYAFLLQGFDGSGPVAIAGLFSADGTGKVALLAGVLDINRTAGPQTNVAIISANSSYQVGLSNGGYRGCLTIATSSATYKFALSLGSLNASSIATKGRMIEADSTGILGSGELRLQDPTAFSTAAVNGNFAFGAGSPITLSTGGANRFVVIGTLNLSNPSSVTGEEDFNLNGQVDGGITTGAAVPITAGTLSISNNGRGTLTLTVAAAGAFPGGTFTESVYVVSATEILFVNIGAQSGTNPMFGGSAKKQSGGFSTSSLSGNLVLYAAGICSTCGPTGGVGPQLTVGVVNIPSTGSFSLAADQVSGAVAAPFTLVGTYTVDSAGRTLFTQTGHNKPGIAIYLVSSNTGYFASSGTDAVLGFAEPQTGGPNFTNASLSGAFSFGTTLQTTENVSDNSGIANFDGVGTVNGTSDQARLGSTPNTNTFSQPYSVTNGTGTPGRGTITNSGTTNLIFYIISSSKIVLINVSNGGSANANPALLLADK